MAYERLSAYEPAPAPPEAQRPVYPSDRAVILPSPLRDKGIALLLEFGCAIFLFTFGAGHLYAGQASEGLAWMFGWWTACLVNFLLCFVLIGFITWPLTFLVFSALSAKRLGESIEAHNFRVRAGAA